MSFSDRRNGGEETGVEEKYIPCGRMPFLFLTSARNIQWTSSFFNHQKTPEGRDVQSLKTFLFQTAYCRSTVAYVHMASWCDEFMLCAFDQMHVHLAKRCTFGQMPCVLLIGQMRSAFGRMCRAFAQLVRMVSEAVGSCRMP